MAEPTTADLIEVIDALRGEVAEIRLARAAASFDQDGWATTLIMVDDMRAGDLVSTAVTSDDAYPMVWRVMPGGRLRNEFGSVWEAASVPSPWRLIWRQPMPATDAPEPEKPARKSRKRVQEPEEG